MATNVKQLVFIDDSGDPGFKLDRGSSKHFVIACIIFNDPLDAEEAALLIKKYRRGLGWRQDREFKFNKTKKSFVVGRNVLLRRLTLLQGKECLRQLQLHQLLSKTLMVRLLSQW